MGAAVYPWNWVPIAGWSLLALEVATGVVVYTPLCYGFGFSAFVTAWDILRAGLPFAWPV